MLTMCHRKVGVVPPKKSGPKIFIHPFGFSTTSRLNGEYLLKERWYRQSDKCLRNCEGFPTSFKNITNFGP